MSVPSLLLLCVAFLLNLVTICRASGPCETDQNPYCAGDAIFEQICCTYPDVCYWANRDGQPACCPHGQVCSGLAPYSTRTTWKAPITTTIRPTTVTTVIEPSTITSDEGGGAVIVTITSQNPVVTVTTENWCHKNPCDAVTSAVVSVYSTITQGAGGVVTVITEEAGQAYATVSGLLVGNGASVSEPTAFIVLVSLIPSIVFLASIF
ncbi:hypothetical protein PV10_03737 [Exophiala mesophila]|uniref:Uncharacterized protein n=1 Tax=Exophiala mesophila TaxID=212818 RepID=A0A0D2A068_EXOME|nr:uncharacterized protein PV10_03737 [Exophiala mesophila]KIV92438.1 hypothetical protein PV10_03737 [Exophiala mesophila]